MKLRKPALTLLASLSVVLGSSAFAANHSLEDKVKAAMQSDIRGANEIARDANRLPLETLSFFGLEPDMTIVELIPGGGWYTKILVPVVAEEGKYYAAFGTGRIEERLSGKPGFEKMNFTAKDSKMWRKEGARFYSLEADSLGVQNVDMVLTFRNYHNFDAEGRAAMNKAAFAALKPGGIYAVVDHTRHHMEPNNSENGRRVDPVLAIKEIQDAGFELVDYSDLHYRPNDKLVHEVGHESVTGQTDRWTLKFKKPE